MQDQLAAITGTTGFDFLHVSDLHGRWILTSGGKDPGVSRRSKLFEQAVNRGTASVGVEVYSADDLFQQKPSLQQSMRLSLIPTPRAAPSDRREETCAMVIRAIAPLRDANGILVALLDGGVIINRDFQLVEVTAGVAHEINNPIAIIQRNLGVMRSELGDAAGAVDTEVELVLEQIRLIHTIVDNLLRYSRSARQSMHANIVDLQRIISDTLALVEHEASAQAVRVVVERSAENRIAIDAHELQQVLVNLLLNAIQASPRGASVQITCCD